MPGLAVAYALGRGLLMEMAHSLLLLLILACIGGRLGLDGI